MGALTIRPTGGGGMISALKYTGNKPAKKTAVRAAAIVAAFAALSGGATSVALADSLRDAMAAAYKYNPRLDAERARQRATDEEVSRAHSGYRPTVLGSADIGYNRTDSKPPTGGAGGGETHPKGYGVTASQPIFSGFRTLNGVRVAEATVRAGRETLRSVEQSILLETVTSYLDVVRDQAIVKLREGNVEVLARELKATRDRFSVGEVTRTDVAQAEARRAAAVSAFDLARANLKTSRAAFERTVGYPPAVLTDQKPPTRLLPKSLNEAVDITLRESPAVVGALYTEQGARHNVDAVWGELLPTVQLDASYAHRYDPTRSVDETETSTVTGRLNVPLYEAGDTHARVRQAKRTTHVSKLQQIEQARTEAKAVTVSAWSVLTAARGSSSSGQSAHSARCSQRRARVTQCSGRAGDDTSYVVAAYTLLSAVGRLSIAEVGRTELAYGRGSLQRSAPEMVGDQHHSGRRSSRAQDLWETHGVKHESVK